MNMKKAFAAIVMCLVMAFSFSGLVACSDNSEELIREKLNEELALLKSPDEETIANLSSSIPSASLAQVGLSSEEVVRALLEGFDGTIDSVTVDGSNADAVVTISCKDFSQLEESMGNLTDEMMSNVDQFAGMSSSEITAWAGQQIMTKIKELPVITHDPVTVNYVKNGNTWEPTGGSQTNLFNELLQ